LSSQLIPAERHTPCSPKAAVIRRDTDFQSPLEARACMPPHPLLMCVRNDQVLCCWSGPACVTDPETSATSPLPEGNLEEVQQEGNHSSEAVMVVAAAHSR
jgi:hypothetical protein